MVVNCNAITCKYMSAGICIKDQITLEDLEYFKTVDDVKRNKSLDDMICVSFEYEKGWFNKKK